MNALILFSYGTIRSIDDASGFYADIFHGKGTDEQIQNGVDKFRSLAQADKLGSNTNRIGRALAKRLQERTGEEWKLFIANHHTSPSIEEAAKSCADMHPQQVITLGLTPFDSLTGRNAYEKRFEKVFRSKNQAATLMHTAPFYNNQSFMDCLIDRAQTAKNWLPAAIRDDAEIVFTAHSKPGTPEAHQQMVQQYHELADYIATALHGNAYHIAYRSGQPAPQRWLGPDVLDVITELSERGVPAVIFVEVLSVIENLEAVQEVTKEAVEKARQLGMEAIQSEYLNDSVDFVDALTEHVFQECLVRP